MQEIFSSKPMAVSKVPPITSKKIGQYGEKIAKRFLENKGYKILAQNYCIQGGEIDFITVKLLSSEQNSQPTIIFFEIKTRQSNKFGQSDEVISPYQKTTLIRTAKYFLMKNSSATFSYKNLQFDLLVINLKQKAGRKIACIKHYQNIFLE